MIEESEQVSSVDGKRRIQQDARAYRLKIKYNDGKVRQRIYAVNNDAEFQSLADKLHVYKMQANVVDVQLLRTRLPNKFADPLRIKYRQATDSPKFLLQIDESGAVVTPSERDLDKPDQG